MRYIVSNPEGDTGLRKTARKVLTAGGEKCGSKAGAGRGYRNAELSELPQSYDRLEFGGALGWVISEKHTDSA